MAVRRPSTRAGQRFDDSSQVGVAISPRTSMRYGTTLMGYEEPSAGPAGLGAADELSDRETSWQPDVRHARLGAAPDSANARVKHFRRPAERPFTRAERERVTILHGGLSPRHDRLVRAGLRGLGYKADLVPTPTKTDYQTGREFGNKGQCNPTHFMVGALINHLRRLRDEQGIPTARIVDEYVFVTLGSCGPCRFGMYEAEYRLALRNAGFEGFRVMTFQQNGNLNQNDSEAPGLDLSPRFFLSLLNAILIGDLLNELACQIRPYEVEPGSTDRTFARVEGIIAESLRARDATAVVPRIGARLLSRLIPGFGADDAQRLVDQLMGDHYTSALRECARLLDGEIRVDFTRARPIAKITGEFWAQTTEGDGNFHMFRFLESQGAEVLLEPITTWLKYLVAQAVLWLRDRRGLYPGASPPGDAPPGNTPWLRRRIAGEIAYHKKRLLLHLADKLLGREYERYRQALGGTTHPQPDQFELQRLAHPYYTPRLAGGEGHLEVAKNIYFTSRDLAHMVLGLKPFGCMPSTQSDGAQAAVLAHHPELIYLPIETSGEGDVNALSRVQMALGDARARTRAEFASALARGGRTLDEIRACVAGHPDLQRPLQPVPRHDGVIGRAANFVLHVAGRLERIPAQERRSPCAR